ncbi:M16 family metallopeptidase [Agromyces aerolatus]|uniref:M16 family metallopeptidase n=1 Tax=Agromyces sp. LY-1074 TaxID=3074080 RepID=UPI002859BBC2|nr:MULTISPECIES: pitrilysin family protein [unclassified Agromyces]MDR5701041.1 pitrilysin family protein [Agromyces sp. LY-1074]MDR5707681.1 pitrilysin family protein [Agromyces sp. LY-1358]
MNGAVDLPLETPELTFEASGDAMVRRTLLPSGVRVLSERVPGARSATIGFWVAIGSRDEHPAEAGQPATFGSTHFLEHLLFKGTRERTALDIAIAFDGVGGEHNALTAKEYTCYYAKVQDRDLLMAVDVLADMFTSSVLDETEFENERGVILEELSMAGDDPADVATERFFEAVLGDHALGRPIGGSPETIRQARRDAVWAHYRANYRPQDLVVTVAGAVDHELVVERLERALEAGGWELAVSGSPEPRRSTAPAVLTGRRPTTIVERPLEQVNLLLGVPGLTATDPRRPTLSVLNTVFGSGMSSRLFQEVRERRGLAYSVYSFGPGYSDAGVFGMYAGCAPAKAPSVAALMRAELERIAEHGVTGDELARAAGQLGGASALALEDSDTRMSRLGRAELTLGEFQDLDEALRRIALVTDDDVRALAADLVARPFSLVAVGAADEAAFQGVVDEVPTSTGVV